MMKAYISSVTHRTTVQALYTQRRNSANNQPLQQPEQIMCCCSTVESWALRMEAVIKARALSDTGAALIRWCILINAKGKHHRAFATSNSTFAAEKTAQQAPSRRCPSEEHCRSTLLRQNIDRRAPSRRCPQRRILSQHSSAGKHHRGAAPSKSIVAALLVLFWDGKSTIATLLPKSLTPMSVHPSLEQVEILSQHFCLLMPCHLDRSTIAALLAAHAMLEMSNCSSHGAFAPVLQRASTIAAIVLSACETIIVATLLSG